MNNFDKNYLMECGYKECADISKMLHEGKIKNLCIDNYMNEPYMLLGRTKANTGNMKLEKGRLVISKADGTILFNAPLDAMKVLLVKDFENGVKHILFNILESSTNYKLQYSY